MTKQTYKFTHSNTVVFFDISFAEVTKRVDTKKAVFITDENIFSLHKNKFKGLMTIVLQSGESNKIQTTIDSIVNELISLEADRSTMLIGVGGGVITDITGFVAAVYMRGIECAFIPTTLLAMVDASIGGKNGINVGVYKNLLGVTKQPAFLFYDFSFLNTLPLQEWQNGFAEIIKHACIKDAAMFKLLQLHTIQFYKKNKKELSALIQRNVKIKMKVVQIDEFESSERKCLNFGHTLGHALENQYSLSHGQAISIGMRYAAMISSKKLGFKQESAISSLLEKYELPTNFIFDSKNVFNTIKLDKKRNGNSINYILLEKIGKAVIMPMQLSELNSVYSS